MMMIPLLTVLDTNPINRYYLRKTLSTNGAGLSESNVQMPFSCGTISLLWCRVTTAATSSSTATMRKNGANANNTISINANTTTPFPILLLTTIVLQLVI